MIVTGAQEDAVDTVVVADDPDVPFALNVHNFPGMVPSDVTWSTRQ
jgi:hypothetical protein